MKDWIHVALAWVSVGCIGVVNFVSHNSGFFVGASAILASTFTVWQWRKAIKKEQRKLHNHKV